MSKSALGLAWVLALPGVCIGASGHAAELGAGAEVIDGAVEDADPAADDAGETGLLPAVLGGQLSGSLTFLTDYISRGISDSDNRPAGQGTLRWEHPVGVYATAYAINVDFDDGSLDPARVETGWTLGLANTIGGFSYDLNWTYYYYPGAAFVIAADGEDDAGAGRFTYDYHEFGLGIGYDFGPLQVMASIYGSPDYSAEIGPAFYYTGSVAVPIPLPDGAPASLSLAGSVGYSDFDQGNPRAGPDYLDWSAGADVGWDRFTFSFRYTDTDLGRDQCRGVGGRVLCDARAVVSVSVSF